MKTEQGTQQKPLSFGFEASSWNYGCFYPSDSYKPKRDKSKELTAPINRNYYKEEQIPQTSKPSFLKSNTLNKYGKRILTKDEKIIQDSQVQNMNHLKRINTSKNISDKPTYLNDKSQVGNNTRKSNTLLNDSTKNNNSKSGQSKIKRSDSLSQANRKNSAIKLGVTYEEWLELKAEELKITKAYQRMAEENKEALEQKKAEIARQYEPTKNEIYLKWIETKKKQKQAEAEQKKRQEQEKLIKKLQRKKESEKRIEAWIENQVEKIEIENRIKEELEKEKQEKRKKELMNEETKQILREKCFYEWLKRKESEGQLNRSSSNNLSKTGEKRERKSKLNIIIGPYSYAKDLREIKRIKENYQDQTENDNENQCDDEIEGEGQYQDQGQDNEQIEEEEINEGNDVDGNEVNEAEAEYYAKRNQADDEEQYEEFEDGTEGNYTQKQYDFYDERNQHFNNISNI